MRWIRLLGVVATACLGIGGAWLILSADHSPRWAIALSGVLGLAGAAAAFSLVAVVCLTVAEWHPALRLRAPVVPMYLAKRNAALVGRRSYEMFPIRFWGVLVFGHAVLFGFMLFSGREYIDFASPAQVDERPTG